MFLLMEFWDISRGSPMSVIKKLELIELVLFQNPSCPLDLSGLACIKIARKATGIWGSF